MCLQRLCRRLVQRSLQGHRRILVITFTLLLVLMLPAFVLINRWPTAASLFVVTATLAAIHISAIVCMQAFLVECLTPTVRSGVFAMTYATGVALLGGTTQPDFEVAD